MKTVRWSRASVFIFFVLLSVYSCKKPMSQDEIAKEIKEKYSKSVTTESLWGRYSFHTMNLNLEEMLKTSAKTEAYYDADSPLTIDELINAIYIGVCQANDSLKSTALSVKQINLELSTEFDLKTGWSIQIGTDAQNVALGKDYHTVKTATSTFTLTPNNKEHILKDSDLTKINKGADSLKIWELSISNLKDSINNLTHLKTDYVEDQRGDASKDNSSQITYLENAIHGIYLSVNLLQQKINAFRFGVNFKKDFVNAASGAIKLYKKISLTSSGLSSSKCFSVEYQFQIVKDPNGKIHITLFGLATIEAGVDRSGTKSHKITLKFNDGVTKDCD